MAVKIRLKRMGKIRAPFYRVVVADSRTKRDGRAIEEIGKYHPTAEPSLIEIDSERAQHWLSVGAQPTEQVMALLKVTGDWQKFKGEPGAEGTLKFAEPRPDKKALYEAALAAAGGDDSGSSATTPKKSRKAEEPKADKPKAEEAKAEEPKADAKAEEPAAAATDGGFGPDSAPATEDGSAPEGFTVKGNKDSMKYHTEGSQWYDATVAEVWFRSAEAAAAAGFEPAGGAAAQGADAGADLGSAKSED
ncbi:hypothetical protein GCM10009583_12450 [Ornithinicoccus hortensis]|uniref:Small ribosomal subunit protein bS16 n=1 Tax=Ornithinicoccus hortensis TaxID=82346 RepID=A0A542YRN8_9MICO|nr:small subunit ribosomal protein S16 [Ornithinicoccus hortensis]